MKHNTCIKNMYSNTRTITYKSLSSDPDMIFRYA